jgi:hypothetical protein
MVDKKSVQSLEPKVITDPEVLDKDAPKVKEEVSSKVDVAKEKLDITKEGNYTVAVNENLESIRFINN